MATLSCTITFVVLISSLVLPLISPTNAQQCTPYSCPLIPSPYTKPGANYILRIGLIESDYTQNNTLSLTRYAAKLINSNNTFLPNVTIEVYTQIAAGTTDVISSTIALFDIANVDALIIELPEADTLVCSQIAAAYKKPVISMNSLTEAYINRPTAPTLLRLAPPNQYQTAAMVHKLKDFKKDRVFYFYTPDTFGILGYQQFYNQTYKAGISVVAIPISGPQDYAAAANNILVNVGPKLNTFVINLIGESSTGFMLFLNQSGYIAPQFLFLLGTEVVEELPAGSPYFSVLRGMIGFKPQQLARNTPVELDFADKWLATDPAEFPGVRPLPVTGLLGYDAVYLYATAINKMMKTGPYPTMPSADFIKTVSTVRYVGVSGSVIFASNGDREGGYVVLTFPGGFVTPGQTYSAQYDNLTTATPFIFMDGTSNVPQNTKAQGCYILNGLQEMQTGTVSQLNESLCVCFTGYSGPQCDVKVGPAMGGSSNKGLLIGIILGALVLMVAVLCGALYSYRKRRAELVRDVANRQKSQINKNDLKLQERIGRGASGEVFKASFRGTEVAVKRLIATNTNSAAVEEFMLETAIMCGLRHPNIVLFMGSCFDVAGKEMLLVMEYHSKGSLHDVLRNDRISLTLDLQIHIACHAAQGMNFLHASDPAIIHRDLKSHNILLDDKWNARISDFGITKIKVTNQKQTKQETNKAQSLGTIFWTAPEVIGGEEHTEKSDCYSFGIVLWELFHRQDPYAGKDQMVVAMEVLNKRLRPTISPSTPDYVRSLIESCWAHSPDQRPSFAVIVERLRAMTMQHPMFNFSSPSLSSSGVEAPTGNVFLVATKIKSVYKLLDAHPRAFQTALKMHNHLVRTQLELFGGYEVKFENFEFLLTFQTLEKAMDWCSSFHTASLNVTWPEEIVRSKWAREMVGVNGKVLWKGPRVSTTVHMGTPSFEMDHQSGHMIYHGPAVDKLKHINAAAELKPGIIVTAPVRHVIEASTSKFSQPIVFDNTESLGGGAEDSLYYASPESLRERFEAGLAIASPAALLHVPSGGVLELDAEERATPRGGKTNWIVNWSDLDVKENIGKGPVGDYYRAFLNGKEVVVKVLVNQGLKEEDLMTLAADASVVSKTKHPNLLEFQAICIDFKHISIITKLVSHGNLRQLLSNNMITINYARKVQLAKQIACGMEYLASHPDVSLRNFDSLKTNNVLITEDWEAKIADYGQSNVKDLARTMTSIATVVWTAPEILCGEPLSPKCAIYSFGVIMWELFTRTIPFETEHPVKVVTKILAGHRPPVPAECPRNYKEIMENCWNTDPELRPSWHVINSDLAHILDDLI